MENVYDLVNEFYKNDEGWDYILSHSDVEAFLRKLAWQGETDQELKKHWVHMMMLCIYMENADVVLEEITADTLVDAVSWCARYVVDFVITYREVKAFLDTIGQFFVFMKDAGKLESSVAPYLAEQMLLNDDGTVAIVDSDGSFLPGEKGREENSAPPPMGRIFLNAGRALEGLMNEIHKFFQNSRFNLDLDRAVNFYNDATGRVDPEGPNADEYWRGFWDYFLFDYRMRLEDYTPLECFRDSHISRYPNLLREMCGAHLSLFTIENEVDVDRYFCHDFMDYNSYLLVFSVRPEDDPRHLVFMENLFDNRSLGMNYLQQYALKPMAQKRLREVLSACLAWYRVQHPGAIWRDFMARHPLVPQKVIRKVEANPAAVVFPYELTERLKNYRPPELGKDLSEVEKLLKELLAVTRFSTYDFMLMRRMWNDFVKEGGCTGEYPSEVWASALMENFLEINEKRAARFQPFLLETMGLSRYNLTGAYMDLRTELELKPSDPRYLNERGYLMLFSPYV
ncbi:MAG: hypothetical protein LKE33_11445 [Acidaminococcus sp.]|jgi:hypothetical protein|nr:hypothetical protein [Acidaminococcus sp.]MCI2100298.1 hypothetical protein [Acidaminococcus sp.]MCI2114626.1 hypothetical protein [Acidaminococcus sp.]MCI2116595.1 hypothetical protein [Acidaminococcus sp.]